MEKETKERHRHYEESFKLLVLRDYYESGSSLNSTSKKWGLKSYTTLKGWVEKYKIETKSLSLSQEVKEAYMKKHSPRSKEEELEARVKELEKALSYEKLRSRGYEIMIEIAEKKEGIEIRKKPGTKQ